MQPNKKPVPQAKTIVFERGFMESNLPKHKPFYQFDERWSPSLLDQPKLSNPPVNALGEYAPWAPKLLNPHALDQDLLSQTREMVNQSSTLQEQEDAIESVLKDYGGSIAPRLTTKEYGSIMHFVTKKVKQLTSKLPATALGMGKNNPGTWSVHEVDDIHKAEGKTGTHYHLRVSCTHTTRFVTKQLEIIVSKIHSDLKLTRCAVLGLPEDKEFINGTDLWSGSKLGSNCDVVKFSENPENPDRFILPEKPNFFS